MSTKAQPIRKRLAHWSPGDRERVAGCWACHGNPQLTEAVTARADLYAVKFPDEVRLRIEHEAKLDVLAMVLGKPADTFLTWLRQFSEAASEAVETFPHHNQQKGTHSQTHH